MKRFVFFIGLIMANTLVNAQKFLDSLEFSFSVTGDFANNLKGGIKQGFTSIGLEAISLGLSTEKSGLWKGGYFFVHGLNAHGQGTSEKFVGDLQCLSNIEAGDYTGLYECWYSQQFSNYTFLVGQHDLNSEFVGSVYGTNFINSSFGIMPTVSINTPISIYPVTAFCGLVKYNFTDNLVFKYAAYDGDPGDFQSNRFGVHWHFDRDEGVMNIAELEYTAVSHMQNGIRTQYGIQTGTYKLGAFFNSGKFAACYDSTKFSRGNYGYYLMADQMIIPKPSKPDEGLAALFQIGLAPHSYNEINNYLAFGLRYHGILPDRSHDFVGFAIAHASIGKETQKHDATREAFETAYEFTYKFEFRKQFAIQPNMQYIVHPGAVKGIDNALVLLLRFQLTY